jgi:hypothetical protein
MKELERILIERDGISLKEAQELIAECREAILGGEEDAMQDILGIEEEYIFDVI